MKIVTRKKFPIVALAIVAIAVPVAIFTLQPHTATATESQPSWPWTSEVPVVFESTSISDISSAGACQDSIELKDIIDDINIVTKEVCLSEGEGFRYGTYFTGHNYIPVVSFGYDNMMYKVKGTSCGEPGTCVYLPETDTMAVKMPISSLISTLELYKNFSKHVKRAIQGVVPLSEYVFDGAEPDYVFKADDGYKWPVGGIGGSRNGKWLALEMRQRGIAILDTETLEMRRVSSLSFQYNFGSMPATEVAISNDGNHVAVTGTNAGLTVIDTYPGCGDEATDIRIREVLRIERPCPPAAIPYESIVERFKDGLHPRFNDDGGELRFYALSYSEEPHLVFMRATSYVTPRMDYIALGDSFSSGEGETDDSYYLPGTNTEFERCHISNRSYPFLLARSMNLDPQYMKSVACSGAITRDVRGDDEKYWGQAQRLGIDHLNVSLTTKTILQTSASENFIAGRIHQLRFVSRYHPQTVTVGIGGNDAGLVDKLKTCLTSTNCNWASSPIYREQTALEIKLLFDRLVSTYEDIHKASPYTEVYAIGYPKIIDPYGQCDALLGTMLDPVERQFMDESIMYINQVIAAAAKKAGVRYIDISDAFGNQRLCGSMSPSVMNSIRSGDDQSALGLKIVGAESFHPRPQGQVLIANAIINAVGNLKYHRYCEVGILFCGDNNTIAPNPSSYWLQDRVSHSYSSLRAADFVRDDPDQDDDSYKLISLPANSLEPDSSVRVEVHSDPVVLAETRARSDGSVNLSIQLPPDLEEGFHTIYLYGTSYSGEKIDLYYIFQNVINHPISPQNSLSEHVNDQGLTYNTSTPSVETKSTPDPSTSNIPGVVSANQIDSRDVLGVIDEPQNKDILKPSSSNLYIIYALIIITLIVIVLVMIIRRRSRDH